MLSVRLTLLVSPGASRDGDSDGVKKVLQEHVGSAEPSLMVSWLVGGGCTHSPQGMLAPQSVKSISRPPGTTGG